MRRDRLAHLDLEAPPVTERLAGSLREGGGALRLRSMRGDLVVGARSDPHHHARRLDAHAASSETARAEPRRIEHAEVQSRRCGDHELGHARSLT